MSISVFTCIFYFFKFLIASKNYLVCNKSSRLLVFCGITDLKNFGKVFDGVLPNEKICPSHMTNLQFYLKMSRVTSCLFHGIHPTTVLLHFTNLKFVIYTKLFKKQICFPVVFNLLNLFFFLKMHPRFFTSFWNTFSLFNETEVFKKSLYLQRAFIKRQMIMRDHGTLIRTIIQLVPIIVP